MQRLLTAVVKLQQDVVRVAKMLSKHPVANKLQVATTANELISKVPKRQRRWIAVGVSVSLHALVLLFLLWPQHSGLSGDGIGGEVVGEGEGFGIDLVSAAEQRYANMIVKEVEVEHIEEMKITIPPDTTQLVESDLSLLQLNVLNDLSTTMSGAPLDQTTSGAPSTAAAGGKGQDGNQTDDGLWNAIAPCWWRLADKYTLPVKMTVSFGSDGMLSVAPTFERDSNIASTEQIIRSETLAVMALAECGSYQMASGRRDVAIDFPANSTN